jgi:hypothetical protein
MNQSMTNPASTGSPADDATAHEPASASADLPLERSRFTLWLASFGLGEATTTLLRPLKTPRNHGGY